jgi:glycosyltransferase involved in cell wall biosynthesis
MRVAIVHYWLVSMRGGEKVLEALCDLYPDADIFTLVCDPDEVSQKIARHRIVTSFIDRLPGGRKHYKSLLPLMPFALENFDLSEYDLVISSESGPAKAVVTRPDALHICYCHSPMRYIWDLYPDYMRNSGRITRFALGFFAPLLRQWDVTTAVRVDAFIANSDFVAKRIRKYYGRESEVIHPPVSLTDFAINGVTGDYYLCAGQLVGYKRVDIAVEAFTRLNKKLVVVGDGAELAQLKKLAGPTITFTGRASLQQLQEHFSACRALVFPGQEDFGIVPLEVMAAGRPVIAYGRGGALETVIDGHTGIFFDDQSTDGLVAAVQRFETMGSQFEDRAAIRAHAQRFSTETFKSQVHAFIATKLLGMASPGLRRGSGSPAAVHVLETHDVVCAEVAADRTPMISSATLLGS